MKKTLFFLFVFLLVFIASCGDKRPGNSETFQIAISGTSILHNAEVTLTSDGKEVAKTTTNEEGTFELSDIESATGLLISVCKGAFYSVAADSDVNFTGCLEHYIPQTAENVSVVVDFLSSFVTKYNEILEEKTALEEWSEYLSMTTSPAPELQSSLTDATKRYLWQQGFSIIAGNISQANNVTPETMYSTENLFNFLLADLADDAVINGSTAAKFGSLEINAAVLKNYIAAAIPEVSETFTAADLAEWTDGIRYSDARFLGGEGTGEKHSEIEITMDVFPEGNKGAHPSFYAGTITVEATAEPLELVKFLKCYAVYGDNEDIIEDADSAANVFEGNYPTDGIENDTVVTIRCDASDGISVTSSEMQITVNNDAPVISAVFFEKGTNVVTGTAENPAQGSVDLKAEASHAKFTVDEITCELEGYAMQNTATAKYQYTAAIDTTKLPEGTNTLKCGVTMNQNHYAATFDFLVANTVSVAVKPYIVNALTDIKAVDVDCGNGFSGHYTTLEGIKLKRGNICIIAVTGGSYESVTLSSSDDLREYGGTIEAVVSPQSNADIVITPITTIDAIVYKSRLAAGEQSAAAYENSKNSLLNHFSKAFSWETEPKNTKTMDSGTKYYILLAGLENLAYFLEMQIDADHGAYSVSNILELMRDDYSDTLFDGAKSGSRLVFGTENKFELDSNFFRYYYATAIKRFLNSDFNKTTITNVGSMLNQIALNSDQYLFPAESETIAIESDGPIIEIESFQNLAEYFPTDENDFHDIIGELGFYIPLEEIREYNSNKIKGYPYFAKAFIVNLTLKPNNGNYIDLNSLKFSESDSAKFEYTRLSPAKIPGDGFSNEEIEFSFLVEYDDSDRAANEKQVDFIATAADVAFNESAANVKTFLDSKAPVVDLSLLKTLTTGADNFRVIYDVSDNALVEVQYCLEKAVIETDAETGEEEQIRQTIKCSVDTFSDPKTSYNSEMTAAQVMQYIDEAISEGVIFEKDGNYSVIISATDRAGNIQTETGGFVVDTTPPSSYAFQSYNSNDQIFMFSGWDLFPQWVYATKGTAIKIQLTDYDSDVASWNVKLRCCAAAEENEITMMQNCSTQEEWFEKSNVAPDETVTFENMPETTVCTGAINVCDKVNNCTELKNPVYTSEELFNNIQDFSKLPQIWFMLWNTPPEFQSYSDEVTRECTTKLPCENKPTCVMSQDSSWNPLTRGMFPHVMVYFSGAESVKIKSMGGDWEDRFCLMQTTSSCNNGFYCDLRGSKTGYDNFKITACNIVGNCSSENITFQMDSGTVEPINLSLTRSFFTNSTNTKLSWTKKDGITYTCKISKEGDTTYSQDCSNGQTIKPSNLNGTGLYTITVDSESLQTKRSDFTSFSYVDTSDVTTVFSPIKKQVVAANGFFQFKSTISSPDNLAQITKIEYFLYGLYKSGSKVDETEHLVKSDSYSSPITYLNNTIKSDKKLSVYGQLRNLRAKITFADGTMITRDSGQTAANSFLYCLLGSSETLNDVQMNFDGQQLFINYNKPDCFSANDYSLEMLVPIPKNCGGYDSTTELAYNQNGSDLSFTVTSEHRLTANGHKHTCDDVTALSHCYTSLKAFSKETTAKITYKPINKTYSVKLNSYDWNNQSVIWQHYNNHCGLCHSCEHLQTTVSCKAGENKAITLK